MRLLLRFTAVAVVALAVVAGTVLLAVRGSLPALDGEVDVPVDAAVSIERDGQGVPVISGQSRADVAFATGFVHAQDRYFQMDLSRRMSAGRLAELVGDAALPADRRNRLHRFESVADRVIAGLPAEQRAILEAYSAGVNAGLAGLAVRPFEYLLLRVSPERWRPRDSLLVVYAMYLQLNDNRADADRQRGLLKAALPAEVYRFVYSVAPEWEAPIDGQVIAAAPIPAADVYDLRNVARNASGTEHAASGVRLQGAMPGSNSWAVAGSRTASGAALVANDMHLGLGVPNTWYRARLIVVGREARDLAGLTLPGVPTLIAGSNGRVAWGFTNSYGDYSDLVTVELDAVRARYRGRSGFRPIAHVTETLRSTSGASEILELRGTEWGPLLEDDRANDGEHLALRWTAHEAAATDLDWLALETAADVDSALAIAATLGGPVQNFVCADRGGNIGWTLLGRIPARGSGYDPGVPSDWTPADAGWTGWLPAARYPRVVNPASGRIWTANNRVVGGEALALIGDGAPDRGARAQQIRDSLFGLDRARVSDMLAIQLDDRALFLNRWRDLLLDALDAAAIDGHPARASLRRVVERWEPRASVGSVGYLHVRRFHERIEARVFETLTVPVRARQPDVPLVVPRQFEEAAWALLRERPRHLLDPRFATWREFVLSVVDEVVAGLETDCGAPGLAACRWGDHNAVVMRHPLSRALPWLSRWLDMPAVPMSGDHDMPHVYVSGFGASERFAVSPGRESEGYLHMPGGQSGHPLSPFYRAGHDAWLRGEPTPFLPGPAEHTLRLR